MANSTSKGKGAAWFKVYDYGYKDSLWCTDIIQSGGYGLLLKIPSWVPTGLYILRSEIIDLAPTMKTSYPDFTRVPGFYSNCMYVSVTSDSTTVPKTAKIPGVYNNAESKFIVSVDDPASSTAFEVPGPKVVPPVDST
ncbi:hypothetical protein GGI04_000977 [Coemansia thaxteri]|nr:hypothetical protein GGI04_000977 [Coemansia thaxteri]